MAPTTSQPSSAPAAPEPGETATALAPAPLAREELSPIERLVAGNTLDPNALLRQFGYDLFTRVPTTFAPVTDVPVGPDYVIGPGDNLNILLWGGVQEGYQVEVSRNGSVALPRLGVVQVWGLTLDQVQRLLQQRFSEFYADFRMAVTLGKLRTILVYVVGEVRQPGAYTVSSLSTIINALFASGGPQKTVRYGVSSWCDRGDRSIPSISMTCSCEATRARIQPWSRGTPFSCRSLAQLPGWPAM